MLSFQKKVGETPLEMLDRLRVELPEFKDERLSYAGRLDPMAEGEMLILVGDENNDREKYLGFDKEYVATFLIGVSTDTGDALGLIEEKIFNENEPAEIVEEKIIEEVARLTKISKQKYPWFSSKTVDGIKLFDHYKNGNTKIERPELEVSIKSAKFLKSENLPADEIRKYVFDSISKVKGDFRQAETLDLWQKFFAQTTQTAQISPKNNLQIFEVKFNVSSGTYIRALTEEFSFPTILLKLNRTKIFV